MEEKQLTESVLTTPASSPDLNPIENVWSAMKTYLRSVVKPKKKEELVQGIVSFWNTLSAEKCGHYIYHVHLRHTSCCLECRWTYPVLVKFCVLSGVLNLSITTVHLLKKWWCLCNFKSWKDIAKLVFWMKCLVVYCWNLTSVHVHKMYIKFWMC